ncbi:ExbD/TolR family protein [Desulfovibrio psychrotolerans]|uniref:Biopolymer transporter ExbD n=1 Tax=Desulfovibrio psychrotolerans TaxID=415242 RepID=A0A7J0BRD1_9BACT|nr:biopolymer transporter ExbD [Desulfovibrio psychrotolerans]GFM36277.1 biopolymer transporter ExbD [Desulfovibrio psychrotolerans]
MRQSRYTDRSEMFNDIDLTPMIDMVFILLIFFIVSTSFIREAGVVVERPAAETAESQHVQIVIAIDADNMLWMEGSSIDIRSLGARVHTLRAENEELGIIVAADVRTRAGVLVEVLDLCRQAGVRNVSVATRKPQ